MGYEVDFLAVGPNSKSGDAIALRFGNLQGNRNEQAVVLIDGGFTDDGQKIIDHIKKYYDDTDTIDIVIATYPHGDHTAGLETILKEMQVKEFWMHKPWNETHTNNISRLFTEGRVTDKSVRESLRKSLDTARELEKIANQRGIPIIEPFVGEGKDFGFGRIDIAGPTKEYYESLLPGFASTPQSNLFAAFLEKTVDVTDEVLRKLTKETWTLETLTDSKAEPTSAENNSSAITLLRVDEKHILFTGDAGIPALTNAVSLLESHGITNESYSFIQAPHHGSKRNVGPTILNRLVGPKLLEEQKETKKMLAFCSCAINGEPKHPSKKVTNSFLRRGVPIYKTQGKTVCESENAPSREGWGPATPIRFHFDMEE